MGFIEINLNPQYAVVFEKKMYLLWYFVNNSNDNEGYYTNILMKSTRKYQNILINRTDFEEVKLLKPGTGTTTNTRLVTANPAHPNGKCINRIS